MRILLNQAEQTQKLLYYIIQKFRDSDKTKWDSLVAKHTTDLYNENTNKISDLETIINYKAKKGEAKIFNKVDKTKAKKDLSNLEKQIATDAWQRAKNDFNYPIFWHTQNTPVLQAQAKQVKMC